MYSVLKFVTFTGLIKRFYSEPASTVFIFDLAGTIKKNVGDTNDTEQVGDHARNKNKGYNYPTAEKRLLQVVKTFH